MQFGADSRIIGLPARWVVIALCSVFVAAASPAREIVDCNFGWKFYLGDGDESLFSAEVFDDSGWRVLNLPHDYQIEQPWAEPTDEQKLQEKKKQPLAARGFKEPGVGWYRRNLDLDPSWKDRRVLLDIGGIMYVGDIWFNGVKVGSNEYGYLGTEHDLTKYINWDGENVVAVRADNRLASRWYTGGGLYRKVHLVVKDPASIARHGVFVSTPEISEKEARVDLQVELENTTGKKRKGAVHVRVLDPAGNPVANGSAEIDALDERAVVKIPLTISHPKLWSCGNPDLYRAEVELVSAGHRNDSVSERFGIRTVEWKPDQGLVLNGRRVKFHGVNLHHGFGALGAANHEAAIRKRFKVLREMGVNGIRLAHNPYDSSFLELADEYGILLVAELFDKWEGKANYRSDFFDEIVPWATEEWIKESRNHASVILYSLGNEIWTHQVANRGRDKEWGVPVYNLLKEQCLNYDDTRKFTVGLYPARESSLTKNDEGYMESKPAQLAFVSDVMSQNYLYEWFARDQKTYPNWVFFQSEATTVGMGNNYFGMPDEAVGLAYWGAVMYLGESMGWPQKGWGNSVVDLSLEKRPQFHYIRSFFSDEPMVHIGIYEEEASLVLWNGVELGMAQMNENWNRPLGSRVKLDVWTNAETVELFLNGRSLGVKENPVGNPATRNKTEWLIDYEPGLLKAVARTGGRVVAEHALETTGEPAALRLEIDNPAWCADGFDLQHIRISAVDREGRIVFNAENKVRFRVNGPARLIAVDNGDMLSNEPHVANQRRLHRGTALAILRSGRESGVVVFSAEADGLAPAHVEFKLTGDVSCGDGRTNGPASLK